MDADLPEDAPLSPPKIHLSSSSPGYSVPIRAPLTIDSDSEFGLSINDQIYSRTGSFNSSSSIDISSYGDEHTSVFEDEHDAFIAYQDDEIVIERSHVEESCFTRPFVRYPNTNYVKERCDFGESTIFRPFVKIPYEESSSTADFGTKLSVPIAPLTRDCDSDNDSDSLDGCSSDDSGWIPDPGVVQKVAMAPKVRSFKSDEGDEDKDDGDVDNELQVDVFSGDDITGIENSNTISTESIENEGCKFECLNEDVKVYELDALSFDLERTDAQAVSRSNSEAETINGDETDDELQIEGMFSGDDINGTENLTPVSTESTETEGCKVECLNEVVNVSESVALSFNLERIDVQIVSSSNNEFETETINVKLSESDEPSFDSERINTQIVSNSDSKIENLKPVSTELIEYNLESFDVKLSESDEPSFGSEKIDTQIVSNSEREIEIKTVKETEEEFGNKNEEEMLTNMQRVRAKFLRLALNEQLTTKVNGESAIYDFDFNLTILAIGKTGVGKSATINTIFGEKKAITSACDPGTTTIQEITGNVDGIQLRVIDAPGLKRSYTGRSYNLRILKSIKRLTRKHKPNVVLYVDRLDTRDVNDSHILTLITSSLGSWVWHSCIIALTHASCESCDPLNESSGFVVQRCRFIQEQIVRCGGNTRRMANRVWLVDNQLSYRHDVMDRLEVLDEANEDDGCDKGRSFELMSEQRDVTVERKKGYFMEDGYRVKLLGNTHWSIGCRLCI